MSADVRVPFAGAVLSGGASRRMGRDKALLVVAGRPLVAVASGALTGAGAEPVRAVGGNLGALGAAGVEAIADLHPGEGPLGGLLTALHWSPHDVVVVLTCDLPAIGPEEVTAVVAALDADPAALVAAPVVSGQPQFLTAAYRRSALAPLRAAFEAGERAVRRAVGDAGLALVAVPGLDPARLTDADTPADLVRAVTDVPRPRR